MLTRRLIVGLVLLLGLQAGWVKAEAPPERPVKIDGFELRDARGKTHRLADFERAKVVVVAFLGIECPLARTYAARLNKFAKDFSERGVAIVAIDANVQDSISDLAEFSKSLALNFPLLKDPSAAVADQFGAQRTPEVFVLDRERAVRYRGRIDDQYGVGYHRPSASQKYLVDAVEQLLADKEVTRPSTDAVGCVIGRPRKPAAAGDVTYARHIAPILNRRCVECHREGDIAPFSLTSYESASGWAESIAEVVAEERMPPWHADPKHGSFRNDPRLSDDEKRLIAQWAKLGAPQGDPKETPPAVKPTEGWRIGKPDQIVKVSTKPFHVPADGEVRYQYFEVDPGFKEDKWVRAAECKPGAREVVHHIIAFVKPPGAGAPDDEHPAGKPLKSHGTLESDWLVATAPGARPLKLPDGLAKFVPAGSKFVFQVHYTPNGTAQDDVSEMGLIFCDAKTVRKEVGTWRAVNPQFEIPPGAENHEVRASYTFRKDTLLLALFPHMHLRGKAFRYEARYPDGSQEVLLDVNRYDFAWQNSYIFSTPKRMAPGTKLICTAHFDNSEKNRSNPDPKASVRWGDQTWDEMMVGYFSMVLTDQDLTKDPITGRRTDRFIKRVKSGKKIELDAELAKLAATALKSSDDMNRFSIALEQILPQLDRVDWMVVEDDTLVVKLAAQSAQFRQLLGGRGVTVPAAGKAIAAYAAGEKPVVHASLAKAKETDLAFMARLMSASVHVPVTIGGSKGVVSFWSAEYDAFPPEAVSIITDAVARMKPVL